MTSETVRARSVTKQLDSLRVPGMFLLTKFNSYKRQQEEVRRKVATEKELNTLHKKIVSIYTCSHGRPLLMFVITFYYYVKDVQPLYNVTRTISYFVHFLRLRHSKKRNINQNHYQERLSAYS